MMFEPDSNLCYAILNVPSNPLKSPIDIPPETGDDRFRVTLIDKSLVVDEIMDLFSDIKVTLDTFALLTWQANKNYSIHSDGRITNPDARKCGFNWHFNGKSHVEWYSFENATHVPVGDPNNHYTWGTHWKYPEGHVPKVISVWDDERPALFNVRQPHKVIVTGERARRTLVMRFLPNLSMEEFVERLGHHVVSVHPGKSGLTD